MLLAGVENLTSVEIKYPSTGDFGDVVDIPLDEMPTLSAENITVIITTEED